MIPILVQAGASTIPTFMAALSAFVVGILRPYRRGAAIALASGFTLIAISGWFLLRPILRVHRSRTGVDWAQVALNAIRREQLTKENQRPSKDGLIHLQSAWEFRHPGASFLSTPAIKDGHIYGTSCMVDVGRTYGSVFCLDNRTGRQIWQVEDIGGQELKGIFSSPVVTADGKYVIVGEGLHFDSACHLICFDAATGKVRWKIDIPQNHVESSPAVFGDFVVVGAGAIERANHLPVDSPGYVLAVRVSDGEVLWRRDVVDPESSPVIAPNGITYIGSGVEGCAIVAINPRGEFLWKTPTKYPVTGPITLADNLVIAGSGRGDFVNADRHPAGAVVAMDSASGKMIWQAQLPDAVLGRVSVGDEKVFCPVRDGTVVALDLKDGKPIWRRQIASAPILGGIALSGQYIYAVSSDGFLAILDAKTGTLREKDPLNDETSAGRQNLSVSTPVINDGNLFVGSETGGLHCFIGAVAH
jgi:outer membrane protein assembly factor BamB